jgi:leucyl/phenylalanyl-tRNA---protein transferase
MNKAVNISRSKIIDPEFLLGAYSAGYFPMAESKNGQIGWYSPDPRAIIPFDEFRISRSLNQVLKKKIFELRINNSFEEVIRKCAEREETWISEEIIKSYLQLHRLGFAHSVETWKNEVLVGGLYGVTLGAAFFGESMFSRVKNSSKVALACLVDRLKTKKFRLLDTQFITPHLSSLGAIEISRNEYLSLLKKSVKIKRSFLDR